MDDSATAQTPGDQSSDPDAALGKVALRRRLIAERTTMPDRDARVGRLLEEVGTWLMGRQETALGAYWAIRGEPDLLPLLGRWLDAAPGRVVGLPVIDPATSQLVYRGWHPGVPMRDDAYGIPTPDRTPAVEPQLMLVPCVGFGPGGVRLGYGGGFFDRTLAAPGPRPLTVGIAYARTFVPGLAPEAHDVPLDIVITEDGVAWNRAG